MLNPFFLEGAGIRLEPLSLAHGDRLWHHVEVAGHDAEAALS